jgi:hypothetical protein
LAERLFALFNQEVFENQLPADMEIFWSSRLVKTAGRCHSKRILGAQSNHPFLNYKPYCHYVEVHNSIAL